MIDHSPFFRTFITDLLSTWVEKAVHENGFFNPFFSCTWDEGSEQYGTPVSQSRLLYNFSCAHTLTTEKRYREAAAKGADFLILHFWDTEEGGWFYSVSQDGNALDERKDSYHHAFAILGLSHAYGICEDSTYLEYALRTLEIMEERFKDPSGGYKRLMTREFSPLDTKRSQNPIMHFFESLLALSDVQRDGPGPDKAREVAEFIFASCYSPDKKCLPEFYTEEWKYLSSPEKGYADAGHQCEWAFLLSEADRCGVARDYMNKGHELLDFAIHNAYDPEQGGICSPCTPDGDIIRDDKGWWEQCEAVRALHRYCSDHGRDDCIEQYEKCISFIIDYYRDPEYGGFYSSLTSENQPKDSTKGTPWKVDYHVTGMCMEIIGK